MANKKLSTTRDILRFEGVDRVAYWRRFAMLLTLSVVIATMGLLRDSAAVVIAAMLIAPLMSPILGIASSMVMGWLKRAIWLLAAVCIAAVFCVLLTWCLVLLADVPRGIRLPEQVMARTDPGTEDLVVALAAGVAGAYVQVNRSEISLLPGAAIGVSLVPPLAACGILVFFGEFSDAYEAALLFATNLAAIILSACVVYLVYAARSVLSSKGRRKRNFTASVLVAVVFLCLIVLQLGAATYNRYLETRLEARVAAMIRQWADPVSVEIIRIDLNERKKHLDAWLIVDLPIDVDAPASTISAELPERIRDRPLVHFLRAQLGTGYSTTIRYQTRLAGEIDLASDEVKDAQSVEDTIGE